MRLIDADALKTALTEAHINMKLTFDIATFNCVMNTIDNAPTVNAISNDEGYEMYGKGYLQGYERGKAEAIPKGEWEEPFERNGKTYHKCNHCHISSELILIDDFCPHCGASMRRGGAV